MPPPLPPRIIRRRCSDWRFSRSSGEILIDKPMDHNSSFAINPPTYANGMIFVGLSDGTIQAFDANTLNSLWIYRDSIGGQPNSSIVYHDGYIYTGFTSNGFLLVLCSFL